MKTQGPKTTATPGSTPAPRTVQHVPDLPPADPAPSVATEPAPAPAAVAATPPVTPAPAPLGPGLYVKDLTKVPKKELAVDPAGPGARTTVAIEADTEEAALELANARGRAVMGPKGWVCPSRVVERIAGRT